MIQHSVRYLLATVVVSLACSSQPSYGMQYTLRVLSSSASSAEAINDNGIVVGSNGYKPYRWDTRAGTSLELHASRGSAMAVNELGAAAGSVAQEGATWQEAFRWTDGTGLERLGLIPGAVYSTGYGINDNGTVVGYVTNSSNWGKAFIATGSTIEEIVPPAGWTFKSASDINNYGVVVGSGRPPAPTRGYAVTYDVSSQSMTVLNGVPWYGYSANEITDSGIVAGRADTLNYTASAAYWHDGTLHAAVNLGGNITEAFGTNDRGDLVGYGYTPSNSQRFFSYVQGVGYHDLSNLGGGGVWHLKTLKDINNHGQIVGVGQHINGAGVAVLITPVNFADSIGDTVTTGGGTTAVGGMEIVFSDVASPGTIYANYATQTAAELIALYGSLPGGLSNGEAMQLWNMEFSGNLTVAAGITYCYDDTTLPFDENDISVSHWLEGIGWEVIDGLVDTEANTVTFSTTSFSPFVLTPSNPIPEPGTLALALIGVVVLVSRFRRKC